MTYNELANKIHLPKYSGRPKNLETEFYNMNGCYDSQRYGILSDLKIIKVNSNLLDIMLTEIRKFIV